MIRLKKGSAHTKHFLEISYKLGIVFYDACNFLCENGHKKDIVVTSIIRPKTTDSGVHQAKRAIDISVRNIDQLLLKELITYINNKYIYDEERPSLKTCICHVGKGYKTDFFEHIHLQTLA